MDIVQQKYLEVFRTYWDTKCSISKRSDKACAIIEPRCHEHLEFVLKNVMYFCRQNWSLYIFHSELNEEFVKQIVGEKQLPNIHLIKLFKGNIDRMEYSKIMTSKVFWDWILAEHVLIFQTDSYIRRFGIEKFVELNYDFVGACFPDTWSITPPTGPKGTAGNGGFSLRRKSKMLQCIEKVPYTNYSSPTVWNWAEDVFYNNALLSLPDARLPSNAQAGEFAVEAVYADNPLGVHKPWVYLNLSPNDTLYDMDLSDENEPLNLDNHWEENK